jgi:hypothetical protein
MWEGISEEIYIDWNIWCVHVFLPGAKKHIPQPTQIPFTTSGRNNRWGAYHFKEIKLEFSLWIVLFFIILFCNAHVFVATAIAVVLQGKTWYPFHNYSQWIPLVIGNDKCITPFLSYVSIRIDETCRVTQIAKDEMGEECMFALWIVKTIIY